MAPYIWKSMKNSRKKFLSYFLRAYFDAYKKLIKNPQKAANEKSSLRK